MVRLLCALLLCGAPALAWSHDRDDDDAATCVAASVQTCAPFCQATCQGFTCVCQDRVVEVNCGDRNVTVVVPPEPPDEGTCPAVTCATRNVIRRRCVQDRKWKKLHLRKCFEVVVESAP